MLPKAAVVNKIDINRALATREYSTFGTNHPRTALTVYLPTFVRGAMSAWNAEMVIPTRKGISMRRPVLAYLTATLALAFAAAVFPQSAPPDVPPMARRAAPGAGQHALQPLVGTWRVDKKLFVAVGTPDHPALGENMTTHREWIADGRFLRDTTEGTIGGKPYFRTGLLGYNNMDHRYEWVTADNFTPPGGKDVLADRMDFTRISP
jgi:hypothetical protein